MDGRPVVGGTPILFGLPLARIEETECQAHGDPHIAYTLSWDAERAAAALRPAAACHGARGPDGGDVRASAERVRDSLRPGVVEDLDTVLHRIVERAANAVRAPSHVLTVSTEPGAEPQV